MVPSAGAFNAHAHALRQASVSSVVGQTHARDDRRRDGECHPLRVRRRPAVVGDNASGHSAVVSLVARPATWAIAALDCSASCPQACFLQCIALAGAGIAAVSSATSPIFAVPVSITFSRRACSRRVALGTTLSVVEMVLLTVGESSSQLKRHHSATLSPRPHLGVPRSAEVPSCAAWCEAPPPSPRVILGRYGRLSSR